MNDMKEAFKKAGYDEKKAGPETSRGKIRFFDEINGKQVIRESLITTEAEQSSERFIYDRLKPLTQTQLRKFYGDVLTIEERLKAGIPFEIMKPQIKMIKSKLAYAWANGSKSNVKIPKSFKDYMDTMIDSIDTREEFNAFKMIFEAIVGYSIGKGAKK